MRIQHNIPALNSHRNLGINNQTTSKNLEKLSSGFRVNRAGDDAAGLAISEKMRGQIRGLAMAEQNTSMGINLIQTAEGGLNETHSILQRMRELAVQSSNGTFQTDDRQQLTLEFNALKDEVDRIATSTHYNGIKLLDGSLSDGLVATTPAAADTTAMVKSFTAGATAVEGDVAIDTGTYAAADPGVKETATIAVTSAGTFNVAGDNKLQFEFDGKTYKTDALASTTTVDQLAAAIAKAINDAGDSAFTASVSTSTITFTANSEGVGTTTGIGITNLSIVEGTSPGGSTGVSTVGATAAGTPGVDPTDPQLTGATLGGNAAAVTYNKTANTFTLTDSTTGNSVVLNAAKVTANNQTATTTLTKGTGLVFQIGANGGQDQRVTLNVKEMSSTAIGLKAGDTLSDGVSTAAADMSLQASSIDTIDNANDAIEVITAATNQVSAQRAGLGALQNRLEHTMNNLGTTKENLTASESTIRDVDMAAEMMDFTKNNILVQAAQAMLAQANQLPQGVLQLLR